MEQEEEKEDLQDPGTWEKVPGFRIRSGSRHPYLKSAHGSAENAHKTPGSEKEVKKKVKSKKGALDLWAKLK